ncbi:MAG: hypothetical protein H0U36_10700 [Nocardioidaceae bacterium]|nr:hypothetical protein [Nocardioidaceae bacterium]
MPPRHAADFDGFVGSHVQRLARVADLLTSDRAEADRMVVAAFARLYRVWPSVARSRDPLAAARRQLVSAYVRGARRRTSGRGQPALQLADGIGAASDQVRVTDVWEAVLDLTPRQRSVLVLRLFEGLTDGAVARTMAMPTFVVARSARTALQHVSMTADLAPVDEIAGQRYAEGRERAAVEVAECLSEHHRGEADAADLVAKIRDAARAVTPHRSRRVPILVAGTAAVLVLAAVVAPRWWGQPSDTPTTTVTAPVLPSAPSGTRLVGYADVVVAVPFEWPHNAPRCSGEVADSVIYPDATGGDACPADPRSSTATFTNPTSSAMYYSSIQPPQIDVIAGRRVLGTALTRKKAAYEQTVIVPSSGFWMVVRSPQRSVVREIVASVQVVPRGFAIVPPCRGQRLREASAELIAAGLKPVIAQASTLSERLGRPPVTYQSVDAGQLVPLGSRVGLSVPSF